MQSPLFYRYWAVESWVWSQFPFSWNLRHHPLLQRIERAFIPAVVSYLNRVAQSKGSFQSLILLLIWVLAIRHHFKMWETTTRLLLYTSSGLTSVTSFYRAPEQLLLVSVIGAGAKGGMGADNEPPISLCKNVGKWPGRRRKIIMHTARAIDLKHKRSKNYWQMFHRPTENIS